jgi:predicted metalloprotease
MVCMVEKELLLFKNPERIRPELIIIQFSKINQQKVNSMMGAHHRGSLKTTKNLA